MHRLARRSLSRLFSSTSVISRSFLTTSIPKMSVPRKLLMIPGPTEFHDSVYESLAQPTLSHVSPIFIKIHGDVIRKLRFVFCTTSGQPFVIGGNGTLGWDFIAANLTHPGDDVLVINTGYFGEAFGDCYDYYGAKVTWLNAPVGDAPTVDALSKTLKEMVAAGKSPRVVSVQHVDTSTGVRAPVQQYAEVIRAISPSSFIAVDGVCATGAEELHMDRWGIDVVMTGAQKALGCPPGVALLACSERAVAFGTAHRGRCYYASMAKWLPIMRAYEEGRPSYFSTPPVNTVTALNTALDFVLSAASTPEAAIALRFAQNAAVARAFVAGLRAVKLRSLALRPELEAYTMTTVVLPAGVDQAKVLAAVGERGVVAAGGLHKDVKATYIRIGHMGVSAYDAAAGTGAHANDVQTALEAVVGAMKACGFDCDVQTAVDAYKGTLRASAPSRL